MSRKLNTRDKCKEKPKLFESPFKPVIDFPQAFSHLARVRHVQVDAGCRIIGECAWHNCQHLQIVHLDSTVLSLQTRVFSRCYALRRVLAPGCREFGAQVFEECVALLQVGLNNDTVNQLAPQAELWPRAFHKCTALRHINLEPSEHKPARLMRCLPECCFLEAGLTELNLPPDFSWMGPTLFAAATSGPLKDGNQGNHELCICTL